MNAPRIIAGCAIAFAGCISLHWLPYVGGNEPPTVMRYFTKIVTGVLAIWAGVATADTRAGKLMAGPVVSAGAATVLAYALHHLQLRPLREAYRRGRKC